MRRTLTVAAILVGIGAATPARAQWFYPFGYGNYGYSQWGADPASGYMAGLGAYAKGEGAYEVSKAQADAINQQTVEKWNKALRARQRALRQEREEEEAKRMAQYSADTRRQRIEDGSTLNYFLDRILDADALATKSAALKLPLSASAVRDIPFESESEAISLSLNQLTAFDSWPQALRGERLATQRAAVRDAVEAALAEDVKGEVSTATQDKLSQSIDALHKRFAETTPELSPDFTAGDQFLKTLAGLSRLVHSDQFRKVLAQLESFEGGSLGDLIVFMHSFNLRFGPASTGRQRSLYNQLGGSMEKALDQIGAAKQQVAAGLAVDASGKEFVGAAHQAFQGMNWKQFSDQTKPEKK